MNRITGLLSYLQPVARYLASPSTELVRFLNQANSLTSTVAPVAHTSAQLFTDMATTFHAWTYLADVVSERTSFGFAQRSMLMTSDPPQPNNWGSEPASAPVNGGGLDTPLGGNAYYHTQNYGAAVDDAGFADCEQGQRGDPRQLNHFDPQRRLFVTPRTRRATRARHTPAAPACRLVRRSAAARTPARGFPPFPATSSS